MPAVEQIKPLTSIRALAAFWIVSMHLNGEFGSLFSPWKRVQWFTGAGGLGVDIFFVLSGFILCYNHSTRDAGTLFKTYLQVHLVADREDLPGLRGRFGGHRGICINRPTFWFASYRSALSARGIASRIIHGPYLGMEKSSWWLEWSGLGRKRGMVCLHLHFSPCLSVVGPDQSRRDVFAGSCVIAGRSGHSLARCQSGWRARPFTGDQGNA